MPTLPFEPGEIKAILFDLDGTLVDTDDVDVGHWARRIARAYRDPERAESAARRLVMFLESPVNAAFTLLDFLGLDTLVVRLMIRIQGTGNLGDLPAVPGVDQTLKRLAEHFRLGVVSTRAVGEAKLFTSALGVTSEFEVFVGRDSTWRIKPHPQPIIHAARTLKLEPQECLMVGDTTVDILAGRRAGAWTCAVLSGYGQRRELERSGAHLILEHIAMLDEVLLGIPPEEQHPPDASAADRPGQPGHDPVDQHDQKQGKLD